MSASPVPQSSWSLFLDRDGVINKRLPGDYVKSPEEFEFIGGVKTALARLSDIFNHIIIVTNQQGIGKGIMTEKDLEKVHREMIAEIEKSGGRIDAVYFCPALEADRHPDRKPATGMALKAKDQFPDLSLEKSIMVGDSASDIQFGRQAGMRTVYLTEQPGTQDFGADFVFSDLAAFSEWLAVHQNLIILQEGGIK